MSFWRVAATATCLWLAQAAGGGDAADYIMQDVKYIWPTPVWRVPMTKPTSRGQTILDEATVSKLADIGMKAFDKYVKEVLPKELEVDSRFAEEFAEADSSRINLGFLRWQKRAYHELKKVPLIDLSWDGSPIPRLPNISYKFKELYGSREYKKLLAEIERVMTMYLNHITHSRDDRDEQQFRTFIYIEVFRYADSFRPHVHTGALNAGTFFARYTQSKEGAQKFSFEDSRGINPPHGKTHNLQPNQGDLVLYPSWASHFLTPHRTNSTNVYFSFVSWPPDGAQGLDWEDDPAGDFVFNKKLKIKKPKKDQKAAPASKDEL